MWTVFLFSFSCMWTLTSSHLVDCFGMLHVVIYHVTQVLLISIHKRGNCLSGKHTLKKAFCAATRGLFLPMSFYFNYLPWTSQWNKGFLIFLKKSALDFSFWPIIFVGYWDMFDSVPFFHEWLLGLHLVHPTKMFTVSCSHSSKKIASQPLESSSHNGQTNLGSVLRSSLNTSEMMWKIPDLLILITDLWLIWFFKRICVLD